MNITSLRTESEIESFSQLFAYRKKVTKMIAISAYTDIQSLEELIILTDKKAFARQKPSLRFFIDSSSSHFFADENTREELLRLNTRIRSFCDAESGIYLVQLGTLFHSKAYLIEGSDTGKVFFGSLNLTRRGITSNEELVIEDEYKISGNSYGSRLALWVKEYANDLHHMSVRIDDKKTASQRRSASCMRQMLLEGVIRYELKEQNPFRFTLKLPKNFVSQQANIDPLLDASVADSISLERLITSVSPFGLEQALPKLSDRTLWKKFCVETCYGHWNPECLREELAEELSKRRYSREPYYKKVLECIHSNRQQLLDCFLQLRTRIQSYLVLNGFSGWKYAAEQKAEADWNTWLNRILSKLDNKNYYDRLVLGISSVPTPDVWSDPLSAAEFEESFCDSLIYLWSKEITRETSNVVAQNIASNLNLDDNKKEDLEAAELQARIENWLHDNRSSISCKE